MDLQIMRWRDLCKLVVGLGGLMVDEATVIRARLSFVDLGFTGWLELDTELDADLMRAQLTGFADKHDLVGDSLVEVAYWPRPVRLEGCYDVGPTKCCMTFVVQRKVWQPHKIWQGNLPRAEGIQRDTMEEYTFPEGEELTQRLDKVWSAQGYKRLHDQVLTHAGRTVSAEGLLMVLSLAIEDSVSEGNRSSQYRLALYANLPAVIRALVPDRPTQIVVLNEYVSMLWRLEHLEGK